MTEEGPDRRKRRAAAVSVASNSALVAAKLAVGLAGGSVSVISEAIHSAVDLLAALVAFLAVNKSGEPADREHPFGHGKLENVSGAVEALLIAAAAAWIVYESVHKLLLPRPVEMAELGATVMLVSAGVNLLVSRMLFRVGRETESIALTADAWHLRTDVYTSAGVMAALAIVCAGKLAAPGIDLTWLDPLAAIAVALLIMRTAVRLTSESVRDLMDASIPEAEIEWMKGYLESLRPTIRSFHRLRTRRSGPIRFIDLHLVVDPMMTVLESHNIAEDVTDHIRAHFPGASVVTHVEPCVGGCSAVCLGGCLLDDEAREAIRLSRPSRR